MIIIATIPFYFQDQEIVPKKENSSSSRNIIIWPTDTAFKENSVVTSEMLREVEHIPHNGNTATIFKSDTQLFQIGYRPKVNISSKGMSAVGNIELKKS